MLRFFFFASLVVACRTASTPPSPTPTPSASSSPPLDAGPARACTPECFRAITCRKGCGGEITSVGCCQCLPGEVDDIACRRDAVTE